MRAMATRARSGSACASFLMVRPLMVTTCGPDTDSVNGACPRKMDKDRLHDSLNAPADSPCESPGAVDCVAPAQPLRAHVFQP